jgi:hypothetical protein
MMAETKRPTSFLFGRSRYRTCALFLGLVGSLMACAFAPGPVQAQSLLSAGGLGFPAGNPDGRARMLGGAQVGIRGGHFSATDPGASGWAFLPGITAAMEVSMEDRDDAPTSGRTRFPTMGIVFPLRGNVYSLGYSGFLSQEWRGQSEHSVDFGDGRLVEALDRYEGQGGVSVLQAGVARRLRSNLAAGVSFGWYGGVVERNFIRDLDPAVVGFDVEPFQLQARWQARGHRVTASASWDATPIVRVGVGVTAPGDLELRPVGPTQGGTVEVPLPLELRLGTEVSLASDLSLVGSLTRADWSDAAAALGDDGSPGSVHQYGIGVEYTGGSLRGRGLPFALGYRAGDLPFSFLGASVSESMFTGGVGLHLSEFDGIPVSSVHLGLERGTRRAGETEERVLRATVTFRVSGG